MCLGYLIYYLHVYYFRFYLLECRAFETLIGVSADGAKVNELLLGKKRFCS